MSVLVLKPSSTILQIAMDFFQHPYYRFNKMMMTFIGQWPDQDPRMGRTSCSVLMYFYVSEMMCRMRTIANNRDASTIVMDCLVPIFILLIGFTFFLNLLCNSQKTLKLLKCIRTDWQVWAREREVNILHEYTELGRKLNIAFAVTTYSGGLFIATEPVVEKIIDIVLRNGTEPGKFILRVDYYHVDDQKYYFYVTIYYNVMSVVITAPALINTIMLISYVHHGSGIFTALGHRLECIGNNVTSVEMEKASGVLDNRIMMQLAWCIDRHNDAIEYVNLIESAYTWNMFISTGLGMILINALGLQVLTQLNDRQVIMTCGSLILVLGLFFLIECAASQILIDCSMRIPMHIYNSQWYRLPPRAQKLLQYMTMRSNVPCQLTAGNMMIMSIRTVWIMLKTVVSYFGCVRSTQDL